VRTGALAVGMVAKTRKGSQSRLVERWTADIKDKFPFCVVD